MRGTRCVTMRVLIEPEINSFPAVSTQFLSFIQQTELSHGVCESLESNIAQQSIRVLVL